MRWRTGMWMAMAMAASGVRAQPDAAQEPPPAVYSGHRLVHALIQTPQEMERMLEISGVCWSCHPLRGVVPFRVAPERMELLRASGIEFDVAAEVCRGIARRKIGELDFLDFLEFQSIFEAEQ